MLPEQQQRILGYFIEEATDHLNTIEQGLLNLQSTLNDPDLINEVFRAAHSIKGGAAMLGLSSIQRTSHRLEDCFKVLKDNPVKIDQKLESLFLGVSDTLKALLEHLSGPFGLTEETANTLMAEAEPVFGWLNEHLDKLVQKSPGESAAKENGEKVAQIPLKSAASSGDKNNSQLQAEVLNKLRQILQLFKQPATPENRQSLQECTDYLAELGDNRNFSSWSNLCRAATSAIKYEQNTYLILAKVVITEIKQALELVLANRESEVVVSEQLEALLPAPEIELLEIDDLEDSEPAPELLVESEADNYHEAAAAEALFLTDIDDDIHNETPNVEAENNIGDLFELSEQIDDNVDRDGATVIHDLDIHGPEVGIAELNTLADLFEGESPELDENWQQEEILDLKADKANKNDVEANIEISKDTDSDLEDFLLLEDGNSKENQTDVKEEMTIMQLFGEDFLEEDLENLKDTASKNFDDSQQVKDKDEINDLLELGLGDKNQNSDEVELDSFLDENASSSEESNQYNAGFEDLNQTGNFELLFADDKAESDAEQQEKLVLPSFDEVGLDTLFGELDSAESDDNFGDLFDDSLDLAVENSGNIWEKTQFVPHEDVAKALEENLIEATTSEAIFANDESDENQVEKNQEESTDTNFDSIFSGDVADNLLESALSGDESIFEDTAEDENNASAFVADEGNSQELSVEEDLFAIAEQPDNLPASNNQDSNQQSVEEDLFAIAEQPDNLP
ncbi:MAG: Hpt domain-containing protein, partial [Rivularia sp. (in: Bacteria)]|nr:Hpt domain-containing protein [Rivularia sp. MS3]